jgi:hypothetical protein
MKSNQPHQELCYKQNYFRQASNVDSTFLGIVDDVSSGVAAIYVETTSGNNEIVIVAGIAFSSFRFAKPFCVGRRNGSWWNDLTPSKPLTGVAINERACQKVLRGTLLAHGCHFKAYLSILRHVNTACTFWPIFYCLRFEGLLLHIPRNPYWKESFGAIELLVLTSLDQLVLILKKIVYIFTKQSTLMRRSSVLSLPLQGSLHPL